MKYNATTNATRKQNFRYAKVLIIDDNTEDLHLITQTLKNCLPEVELIVARNEEQAIDYLNTCLLQEWKLPKLILLDIYMPRRDDGWRVLKRIKELPAPGNHIPVVVLSHSTQKEDIREAYDRGGSSYLIKPKTSDAWLTHFQHLRTYWWETVSLPQVGYRF